VATGQDGTDRIWDTHTGELRLALKNHQSPSAWVEFDPSSRLVVSVDQDGEVAISDVTLRATVSTLDGPTGLIRAVHFDPRGQRVIAASWDGTARIWDTERPYLRWATQPLGPACGSLLRDEPDRRFIAVACGTRDTTVWDTHDPAGPKVLAKLPAPTPAPANYLSPAPAVNVAGDRAAIANGNTVTIYELPGGHVVRVVHHDAAVTSVAFGASGRDLVTGGIDGLLVVTPDGRASIEVARLPAAVDVAAFLPDGRVVAADARPQFGVYGVAPHAVPVIEQGLTARATVLRSSSDGRRLLVIPTVRAVRSPVLWDLENPRQHWELDSHNAPMFSARFVDGERAILTASSDGIARLWDAHTGRLRKSYTGRSIYMADAVFDPEGAVAVTASGDGKLRFWDVSSGHMIWTLQAHESAVIGIHFDGTSIVTRAWTGEMARWEFPRLPSREPGLTVDHLVRCLPRRFDDETAGLVDQDPRCGT
jgi:WD40 repeat protein